MENKKYIQWYYYKLDVVAEFVCPQENTETGWELSYAMSLDPLKYYKKKKDMPDWYYFYKIDKFENLLFRWEYYKAINISVHEIFQVCNNCMCDLTNIYPIRPLVDKLECPNCKKQYLKYLYTEKIKILIKHRINSNEYKKSDYYNIKNIYIDKD